MSSQLNVPVSSPPGPMDTNGKSELPREYGVTRLALLPREPDWLHAYWEVAPYTWEDAENNFGADVRTGREVLRLYFGEDDSQGNLDVDVRLDARSWYVQLSTRARRCRAELGIVLPDGRFALLALSNEIWVPAGRASERIDEKWGLLKAEWERLFELSGGGRLGVGSLDIARALAQHWEFLSAVSSWPSRLGGASWPTSPRAAQQPHERLKGFWLVADCELVIYGATEPSARVRLQGQEIALNPDGTFSLRLALTPGRLEIPVEAVNSAGDMSHAVHFSITAATERRNYE